MPTAAETVRVRVLGPVRVADADGRLVEPPGARLKALVVALVVLPRHPGGAMSDPVSTAGLIDELWGDEPPRDSRAALQTLVSRLRRIAPSLVVSTAAGYALGASADEVDLLRAEAAATGAATDGGLGGGAGLDAALALWRGDPGADLGEAPVVSVLADRAGAVRDELLEARARARAAAGDHDGALADLEPLLAAHPFDEQLARRHLEWLAASGRGAEAAAAFATFRARLADQYGTDPGPELIAAHARILRDAGSPPAGADPEMPVRIGLRSAPNELIGRGDDLDRVRELLAAHRLVTLLGAGGLGKTRLAQAVAASSTAPAVVVVELASIRTDDDVALALATTLGVRDSGTATRLADGRAPDVRRRIVDELAERPTLLVLDNCEQVIGGAAQWVSELLADAPELRVLTTSRSPLAIGAEHVYPLSPLSSAPSSASPDEVPPDAAPPGGAAHDAAGPAVRLFLERARAVRPTADLPVDAVARLCDRLDGLPLAIELAAARIRSLTVEQIETRLANRFALLDTGDRAAPERQRTLLAVIEWSWALLSPGERRALLRLSWFVDGFDLDAASAVLAPDDALRAVDGLVGQSLLGVREDAAGAVRYRMLETVREFGRMRLAEDAAEQDAVAGAVDSWAVALCRRAVVRLRDRRQLEAMAELVREEDNLVDVMRGAIERRAAPVVFDVFAALGLFWTLRTAHTEVIAFSEPVLDATRGARPASGAATGPALALCLIAMTGLVVRERFGLRALVRLRKLDATAGGLPAWLAATMGFLRELPDFDRAGREVEAMTGSADDATALLGNLVAAQFAENDGTPELAIRRATRAYELAVRTGDVWAEAMVGMMLAQLESQSGRPESALVGARRAREQLERIGAEQDLHQADWTIAAALLSAGRPAEAAPLLAALHAGRHDSPDGVEMSRIAALGEVELARLEGRTADAEATARNLVDEFGRAGLRGSPWFLLTLATLVAAGVRDGWEDATVAAWADALRRRAAATLRADPQLIDKPILGSILAGWSTWAVGHPSLADRATELFTLAEALHARQDLPALDLDGIASVVVAAVGVERLDEARRRTAARSAAERAERAADLVKRPVRAG
ncbi:BTAD domain-containing putative transcriptional regulator [Agromyces sp. LHK192]|uniref:AfsR/SARP family transcriptional regulator n=1 Tax=Agromyces sp. LHK192 TaxID=2498704 RepID=UPI000FDC27B8|nr:BTAD domain-containing putative transcriptional regulator [Agromyces sp. LHK192]